MFELLRIFWLPLGLTAGILTGVLAGRFGNLTYG
jgi:hypothetical protein